MDFSRTVVLEPRDLWWERNGVFNPAAIEIENNIHLLYRAVGSDHISRFGLAVSQDGETFNRLEEPILDADGDLPVERLGIEDPRAVRLGNDIYVTYTAASVYPANKRTINAPSLNTPMTPWRIRSCMARTRDCRHFQRLGIIFPELDTKNSVLFNRKIMGHHWLIHRVVPSMYISRSRDLKNWQGNLEILAPKESWEETKVGAACPPIEVEQGWLLIYHGVSRGKVYSVGAALLAKENPAVVINRTKEPIMAPRFDWEKRGYVSNVVFPTGYVMRQEVVYLYYGAADRVVGLAKIPLSTILSALNV